MLVKYRDGSSRYINVGDIIGFDRLYHEKIRFKNGIMIFDSFDFQKREGVEITARRLENDFIEIIDIF